MPFHPDSLPDLTGKVFIVTGGNSGIGYHTVAHLAVHGAHVYMCSRSAEKGTAAIANIQKSHPSSSTSSAAGILNISLLQMDLTELASVVAAAKRFLTLETSLHGLINNAGIMATPLEITKDGHEAQWQTNYLAHWVLTEHLLPIMLRTAKALPSGGDSVRIVNVTSSGHLGAPKGGIEFADPSLSSIGPWQRYGQSKLANILHTRTLHKRYGPSSDNGRIWVAAVHPGLVETNLASAVNESFMLKIFSAGRKVGLMWPAEKGSWNSLFFAASREMKPEQSGGYHEIFGRFGEPWWQSAASKDEKLADKLEEWTREVMTREGWVP
ncbi:hypothetical protein B0H66DRAFT_634442 [Apodospora peruviana]|uniref:NAD(P)-binding protein n=1 Tax=Apodospora peruviana TaxID=516989 RepID=A0AAE0IQG3_9PEZI|nr:hypothetical protein B0H66DRAFT_634442 [Apodospora peruviana]